MSNDTLIRKREVVTTTNSAGWRYIKALAEDTVRDLERKAIDEDDDEKGNSLRREAKAARKFLNSFLLAVESQREADAPEQTAETTGDYFYEVAN
jgi:hypothetical protein